MRVATRGVGQSVCGGACCRHASLIDNYVVTGTETNGKPYDGPGPLAITMDCSGALELKWDGGKYVGIGYVTGNQLAVATVAEGRLVLGIINIKPDGSLEVILAPDRRGHQGHRSLEEEVTACRSC